MSSTHTALAVLRRVLVLALILVYAGCAPPPEEPQPPTPTPQPTPTRLPPTAIPEVETPVPQPVSRSALQDIRERGELRVGVLYNYPPFGYLEETGEVGGYEVELVRRIADRWEVDVSFVQVTRQTRLSMLNGGEVDFIAAAMPHTRDMEQFVEFTSTTFRSGYVLLVRQGSSVATPADLAGGTVAVGTRDAAQVVEARAGDTVSVDEYPTIEDAVAALTEDTALSAVVGRREQLMLAADTVEGLTLLDEFITVEPYAFAVRRGDTPLRDFLNLTLQQIVNDGEYGEIYSQNIYGYGADVFPVLPGEAAFTLQDFPTTLLAGESVVERIRRGEPVRVAGLDLDPEPEPFEGQPIIDGYNRAILNEFAQRWNVSIVEVADSAGEDGLAMLFAGEVDLVVGVRPDTGLIGRVAFTQPYYQRGLRLLTLDDVVVRGISDLNLRDAIAVTPEDISRDLVQDNNAFPQVVSAESLEEAFETLTVRGATAIVGDEYVLALMAQADDDLEIYDARYRAADYVMALAAQDAEFQALVNFTLQDMAADGTLEALAVQYFQPYRPEDEELETFAPEIWPGDGSYLLPGF